MYIVKEGWLKVVKTSSVGREIILNILGPGNVFNTIAVFVKFNNPDTVIAYEKTNLYSVRHATISKLLDINQDFPCSLLEQFALQLQKTTEMIGSLSLQTVENRLANFIISGADDGSFMRSKWALESMIGLAITGILMARQSGQINGLFRFDTPYATILSLKHLFSIAMAVIALIRLLGFRKLESQKKMSSKKKEPHSCAYQYISWSIDPSTKFNSECFLTKIGNKTFVLNNLFKNKNQ